MGWRPKENFLPRTMPCRYAVAPLMAMCVAGASENDFNWGRDRIEGRELKYEALKKPDLTEHYPFAQLSE